MLPDVDRFPESEFWKLLEIDLLASEPGKAKLRMPVTEKHTQLAGVVHGGATAALIDSAVAAAIWETPGPKTGISTIEMKINFLLPVQPGDELIAEAKVIQSGRRIGVGTTEVYNKEGHMVAFGTATYMIFNGY